MTREQPVLVGTTSIETSELLSGVLKQNGIPHEVLNAKQHEREAHIVENAGMPGKVTIATNMAGRGTDIKLGGNNEAELEAAAAAAGEAGLDEVTAARIRADWQARHDKVVAAGGLHIIGTERHESRRIDNQLRGRSGRQGDPGSSRFYLSMEDNLMRIFGDPARTKRWLALAGMKEGEVIESGMLTKPDRESAAQGRKPQLRHPQAAAHLRRRGERPAQGHLPAAHRAHGRDRSGRCDSRHPGRGRGRDPRPAPAGERSHEEWNLDGLAASIAKSFATQVDPAQWLQTSRISRSRRCADVSSALSTPCTTPRCSASVCRSCGTWRRTSCSRCSTSNGANIWARMDYLRQGIHLRGYAQKDYRYEYKREAFELFAAMLERIKFDTVTILATLDVQVKSPEQIEREEEQRRERLNRALKAQHAEAASLTQLGATGEDVPPQGVPPPGARQAPPPMPQPRNVRCVPLPRSGAISRAHAVAARNSRTATACSRASSRWTSRGCAWSRRRCSTVVAY